MTFMITREKLRIFVEYNGDPDMFARVATVEECQRMNDHDWQLLEILLQDAIVLSRHLGSEHRNNQARHRLKDSCDGPEVVKEIMKIAESYT